MDWFWLIITFTGVVFVLWLVLVEIDDEHNKARYLRDNQSLFGIRGGENQ